MGPHLYIGGDTLVIYDISDPDRPRLVGASLAPAGVSHIDVSEGFAYGGGLVTDISNPAHPFPAAAATIPSPFGAIGGTDGEGDLLFVSQGLLGLHIFQIFPAGPPDPVVVPTYPLLLALFLVVTGAWVAVRTGSPPAPPARSIAPS